MRDVPSGEVRYSLPYGKFVEAPRHSALGRARRPSRQDSAGEARRRPGRSRRAGARGCRRGRPPVRHWDSRAPETSRVVEKRPDRAARARPLARDNAHLWRPSGPEELRLWWSLHDGVAKTDAAVTPLYALLSLDNALDLYELEREIVEEVWGPDGLAEEWWPQQMVPVFWTDGGARCARCSDDRAVTLHLKEHTPVEDWPRRILAPSLGDLVSRWAEAHERGLYRWSDQHQQWEMSDGRTPEWNASLI
jgi:hypothetical protein